MRQRGPGACGTVDCCHEREGQTHPWEAPPGGTHRPVDPGVRGPALTTERAHPSPADAGLVFAPTVPVDYTRDSQASLLSMPGSRTALLDATTSAPPRNVAPEMAAPDDRHAASSEPRAALRRHGSCVLAWRPPGLALSGTTFLGDPLGGGAKARPAPARTRAVRRTLRRKCELGQPSGARCVHMCRETQRRVYGGVDATAPRDLCPGAPRGARRCG